MMHLCSHTARDLRDLIKMWLSHFRSGIILVLGKVKPHGNLIKCIFGRICDCLSQSQRATFNDGPMEFALRT